jgi:hypothetical protein
MTGASKCVFQYSTANHSYNYSDGTSTHMWGMQAIASFNCFGNGSLDHAGPHPARTPLSWLQSTVTHCSGRSAANHNANCLICSTLSSEEGQDPRDTGEVRTAYRIFVGSTNGNSTPNERPGHRWEDNIKTDLKEIGYEKMDWMKLALDN